MVTLCKLAQYEIVKLYLCSAINPLEYSVAVKQLPLEPSTNEVNGNHEKKLKLVINFC